MDDSVRSLKEDDDKTKAIQRNFNEKKVNCKTQNFYVLVAYLLITISLLIAVSIYCCLIKYRAKQKHSLPFHHTKSKTI